MEENRFLYMVFLFPVIVACKGNQAVQEQQPQATVAPAPIIETAPKQQLRGVKGEPEEPPSRVPSSCPEGRRIESGDTSSPAGTVFLAYQTALRGDDPEAFETFYSLFLPEKRREDVRRELWGRLREHVRKYTASDTDASYVLCRSVPLGPDRVKIFVKCNDPHKSDPPIVLQNVDGVWKIDVLTP